MGQAPKMGVYAAHEALQHSGLPEELLRSDRTAMIIGHGGVAQDTYQQCYAFKEKGLKLGGTALQRVMNDTVSAHRGHHPESLLGGIHCCLS